MFKAWRFAAVGIVSIAAAGLLVTACSDGGDDDDGDDDMAIVAAIQFLDTAGFHGIDESINDDDEIPGSAASTARKAQAVIDLAEWPDDFEDEADALEAIMADLATELEKESPDMAAAGEHAARAHDGQHDFSALIWNYLREKAGIAPAQHGGDEAASAAE